MKILKILATLIAVVVIVLAIGYLIMGYTLPDETVVRTEFDVAAPPEKVWLALTDHQKYPEWAPNVARVEVESDRKWKEYLKDSPDPISFSVVSEKPSEQMEISYAMGEFFEGHWKGEIKATPAGAHVTVEDRMRVKSWAMKIMMYPFFDLNEFVKTWNGKLKERAESLK
jgi:uncharacterized protein YndB with AHSA1/START domain